MRSQERISDLRPERVPELLFGCPLRRVTPLPCLRTCQRCQTKPELRKRETFVKQNDTFPQETWDFFLRQVPERPLLRDPPASPCALTPSPRSSPRDLLSDPPAHPLLLVTKPQHAVPLRKGPHPVLSRAAAQPLPGSPGHSAPHTTHTQTQIFFLRISSCLPHTSHICPYSGSLLPDCLLCLPQLARGLRGAEAGPGLVAIVL